MPSDTARDAAGLQGTPSNFSDAIFARRLREIRQLAGMTQQQLADRMTAVGHKMHRSAIAKIEVGNRPVSIGEAVQSGQLGAPLMDLVTDAHVDLPEERLHRERVEAMIRVRSLQHEVAERHKYLDEAKALDLRQPAPGRPGGGVAWDDAASMEQTLAAESSPLGPSSDGR